MSFFKFSEKQIIFHGMSLNLFWKYGQECAIEIMYIFLYICYSLIHSCGQTTLTCPAGGSFEPLFIRFPKKNFKLLQLLFLFLKCMKLTFLVDNF